MLDRNDIPAKSAPSDGLTAHDDTWYYAHVPNTFMGTGQRTGVSNQTPLHKY